MKTELETLSPTKVVLTIEIDEDKVKSETQKVFQEMAKQVQVKGFRKGKAPHKIAEKHINRSLLEREVIERLVPSAYEQSLKERQLRPAASPQFELVEFKPNESIKVKATFEKLPEFNLPDYKGIEVKIKPSPLNEEDIEKSLKNLQAQRATYEDLPNGTVEENRGAVLDFQGFIDGKPFEGGSSQGLLLDINKEQFLIPGFMEQIVGMKAGDNREIKTQMPANFGPALSGKEVIFNVHVQAVKEKKLPSIDDAFAKTFGEFASVEELKGAIRKNIQSFLDNEEKNQGLQKALEILSNQLEFQVPSVFIEEHLKQLEREHLQHLAMQGQPFDEYLKTKYREVFSIEGPAEQEKMNRAITKFREDLQPMAMKQGKLDLILNEIARKESLQVTQDELNSEIHRLAENSRMQPQEIVKVLEEQRAFPSFAGGILRAKAALLIKNNLKIVHEKND